MDAVQAALRDPVSDRFGAEPECEQLAPRDDAMLPRRHPPSVDGLRGHNHQKGPRTED
jgi:hypothetical protein